MYTDIDSALSPHSLVLGAVIGVLIRDMFDYSVPRICKRFIEYRSKVLADEEREEIMNGLLSDMECERSLMGKIHIALGAARWYKHKVPQTGKDEEE